MVCTGDGGWIDGDGDVGCTPSPVEILQRRGEELASLGKKKTGLEETKTMKNSDLRVSAMKSLEDEGGGGEWVSVMTGGWRRWLFLLLHVLLLRSGFGGFNLGLGVGVQSGFGGAGEATAEQHAEAGSAVQWLARWQARRWSRGWWPELLPSSSSFSFLLLLVVELV